MYKKNLILTPLKDKDGLIVYGCRITEYTITFVPIDDETPAACGVCILGKMQYFGKTLMNPKKSLVNYDVKESGDMVATTCSLIGIKSCCSDYIDKKHQFGIHNIYRCYIPKSSQSLGTVS